MDLDVTVHPEGYAIRLNGEIEAIVTTNMFDAAEIYNAARAALAELKDLLNV